MQMNVSGLAVLSDPAIYAWLSYMPRKKVNPKLRQQQHQQQVEKVTVDPNLAHVASPLQGNLSQGKYLKYNKLSFSKAHCLMFLPTLFYLKNYLFTKPK